MTPKQFLKGYQYYNCVISASLAKDPVLLHKHPVEMERVVVYDRTSIDQWLSTHQYKCMNTRQVLTLDQREHVSIKKEMVAFLLDASKAYSTFPPEELKKYDGIDTDGTKTNELTKVYNEIQVYLKELSSELVLEEAKKLLVDLEKDNRANIPFDGVGRLIGFGIEADYNKQRIYAQSQPLPPQQARPIQSAPQQLIQQNYNSASFGLFLETLLQGNLIPPNNLNLQIQEEEEQLATTLAASVNDLTNNNNLRRQEEEEQQLAIVLAASLNDNNNPKLQDEEDQLAIALAASLDDNIMSNNNWFNSSSSSNNFISNVQPVMYGFSVAQQRTIAATAQADLERERVTEFNNNRQMQMGFGEMLKIKFPAHARSQLSHLEFWYNGNKMYEWPSATKASLDEAEQTGLNLTHLLGNPDTNINRHLASIKMINKTGQLLQERQVVIARDPKSPSIYLNRK